MRRGRWRQNLGLLLIVAACVLWVAVLLVPILPLVNVTQKAIVVTSLLIVSEIIFWLGILLAGKELAHQYRQQLNPLYWWQKFTKK